MLLSKSSRLFLRLFIRVITIDAEALVGFGIVDRSAVVGKAVCLHRPGHIALCRCFRFLQRLTGQFIVKAVLKMVIGFNLIGCGHLRGVTVNGVCGQPLRLFREGGIQFTHLLDVRVNAACPKVLFAAPARAKKIIAVSPQTIQ